jgi:hypothetical protein
MFSDKTLEIIRYFIKLSRYFCTILYDWDHKTRFIVVTKTPLRKILFFFGAIHTLGYAGYLVFSFYIEISRLHMDYPCLLQMFCWMLYYMWVLVSYLNVYTRNHDFIRTFKGLKLLEEQLEGIKTENTPL